jgi:protein phosphatase
MSLAFVESAELSDLGLKRTNNEDACLRIPEKGVYCVADGMGGVTGGDLASKTIVANVQEAFNKAAPEQYSTLSAAVELLGAAVNKASKWIKDFADEKVIGQMGSTLVGLVFDPRNPSRAVVLHAGDSRLYRWRAGKLEQLTADHTAAAVLSASLGRDPASFPARFHNELARAVGLKESVELEASKVEAKTGDVFLLCSDGLPHMVPDTEIGQVFASADPKDLAALSRALVQKANEAGGKDNITVVVLRMGDLSQFANAKPEPDDQTRKMAPWVASGRDSTHTDLESHSPPTPATARDDLACTQIGPSTSAPTAQEAAPDPKRPRWMRRLTKFFNTRAR